MLGVALSLLMACGHGQGDADKASVKVKVKTEQVGQAVTPGCEWHYVGQIESGLQPFSLREMNKGYTATVSAVQPLFSGGPYWAAKHLQVCRRGRWGCNGTDTEKGVCRR